MQNQFPKKFVFPSLAKPNAQKIAHVVCMRRQAVALSLEFENHWISILKQQKKRQRYKSRIGYGLGGYPTRKRVTYWHTSTGLHSFSVHALLEVRAHDVQPVKSYRMGSNLQYFSCRLKLDPKNKPLCRIHHHGNQWNHTLVTR